MGRRRGNDDSEHFIHELPRIRRAGGTARVALHADDALDDFEVAVAPEGVGFVDVHEFLGSFEGRAAHAASASRMHCNASAMHDDRSRMYENVEGMHDDVEGMCGDCARMHGDAWWTPNICARAYENDSATKAPWARDTAHLSLVLGLGEVAASGHRRGS